MAEIESITKILKVNKKAQSMLEYALIIGVTVGALLTMFHFYGRSIQGKIKESVDSIGGQFVAHSKGGVVVTPGMPHAANISEAMRKTSGGFSFHTGLLPLGMTIGLSTGRSITTTVAQVTHIEDIEEHEPLNTPEYETAEQAEQGEEVSEARRLANDYGGREIPEGAAEYLNNLH